MDGPYNFPPVCLPATFINLSQFHSLYERLKGTTQKKEEKFQKRELGRLLDDVVVVVALSLFAMQPSSTYNSARC